MREHETEPVPGLPQELPEGEAILWQGAPTWKGMMRHGFHLHLLALYFVALAVWRGSLLHADGASALEVAGGALWLLVVGAAPILLVALFSALSARSTLYTVTDRRVVLRVGVALPMTINIPYASIQAATLRRHPGGGGDIVLTLVPRHRISYVALWPHVRGLRMMRPEPVLRALADVDAAAQVLAGALAMATGPAAAQHRVTLAPAPRAPTTAEPAAA
jgi:hypothetical protein